MQNHIQISQKHFIKQDVCFGQPSSKACLDRKKKEQQMMKGTPFCMFSMVEALLCLGCAEQVITQQLVKLFRICHYSDTSFCCYVVVVSASVG